MLENEYEQLVEYIKEIIADGGHLTDIHDANILTLLQEIDRKKSEAVNLSDEITEPLINRISGERVNVFYMDDKTIQMLSNTKVIIYPKDKIWYHFEK